MEARYFVAVLALIPFLSLPGCNLIQSESVALCTEAMKMNADQLGAGEEHKRKFIQGCRMKASVYTTDQWKCIIAEMKQGKAYAEATEQCRPK